MGSKRKKKHKPLGCIIALIVLALLVVGSGVLYIMLASSSAEEEPSTEIDLADLSQPDSEAVEEEEEAISYKRPPRTLEELIHRYAAAQGGEHKIDQITSMRIQGHIEQDGKIIKFDQVKRVPNKSRSTVDYDGSKLTTIDDGEIVWRSFDGHPIGYRIYGEDADAFRKTTPILSPLWTERENPDTLKWLDTKMIDEIPHYRVLVQKGDESDQIYWIDGETYIEHRMETITADGKEIIINYSDFRKVGWITIPYLIEQETNGEITSRIIIDKADLNAGVLTSYFEQPEKMEDWPPKIPQQPTLNSGETNTPPE